MYDLGYRYERTYGACSQATLLAIMDTLGEREDGAFRAAFGFAGGIGSLSQTCGALCGGVMAIGLRCGRSLQELGEESEENKRACLQMVRDLYVRFTTEFRSAKCAEIHQRLFGRTFDQWDPDDFNEFIRLGGHRDKCTRVVGRTAQMTVELLGLGST